MKITIEQYVELTRYHINTKYCKDYHLDKFNYIKKLLTGIVNQMTDGNVIIHFCYTSKVYPEIVELNNQLYIIFDLSLFVMFSELYTLKIFKYRFKKLNTTFFYYNKYNFVLAEGEKELAKFLKKKSGFLFDIDIFSTKFLYNEIMKHEGITIMSLLFVINHEIAHYIFESKSKKVLDIKDRLDKILHIDYSSIIKTIKDIEFSYTDIRRLRTVFNNIDINERICDAWAILALKSGYKIPNEKKITQAASFALSSLFYIRYIQDFIFDSNYINVDNRIMYMHIFLKKSCVQVVSKQSIAIMRHKNIGLYKMTLNRYFYNFLSSLLSNIYVEFYHNNYDFNGNVVKFFANDKAAKTEIQKIIDIYNTKSNL